MKAAVMAKPYEIRLEQVECPEPQQGEVLVRMEAIGICGGDLHFYTGAHPYAQYPSIYGHECCGFVEHLGPDTGGDLRLGDRVAIEPAIPCGKCYPCSIGKTNCCPDMGFVGAFGRQGGFAEYVTVPAANLHRLPDGMDMMIGALSEPFTIGAQAVNRSGVQSGSTVTLLGAGPIGLTIIMLLKKLHDVQLAVIDVIPERLERAREFGADLTINARKQNPVKLVEDWTSGEGSNIVMEAAGQKLTMEQAVAMVSPGGRVVITGLTNDKVEFPGILFTKKEMEILGSRNSVGLFPFVLEFLNQHVKSAERYVTRTMDFEHIVDAFQLAKSRPDKINKIVLKF